MTNDKKTLSAYEKAAQEGIDPRCIPQHLTEQIPIGDSIMYPYYTEVEKVTWKTLYTRQMSLLQGRACDEYIHGVQLMHFSAQKIPALREVSHSLQTSTGWQVGRVPGLIHEKDFFELLKKKVFPSTDYIRQPHEIDYTPAPDMFHDVFGHTPLLTNPYFASFYQKFGIAALKAHDEQHLMLEHLHWFTVEFGLIETAAGKRIYGAGIISSLNEVTHALSDKVIVHPFDVEKICSQHYEVWHLQPELFVIKSFEQLDHEFTIWAEKQNLL